MSDCIVVIHLVAIYVAVVFTDLREVTVSCDVDLIQCVKCVAFYSRRDGKMSVSFHTE